MRASKAGELLYYGGEDAYLTNEPTDIMDILEAYIRGRVYYCDALNDIEVMVVTDFKVFIGYDEDEMYEAQEFFDDMGC